MPLTSTFFEYLGLTRLLSEDIVAAGRPGEGGLWGYSLELSLNDLGFK